MIGKTFPGFSDDVFCEIPAEFFTQLLPLLQDSDEIKVVLYALWHAWQNGASLGISRFDIEQDEVFSKSLTGSLQAALEMAREHNALIIAKNSLNTRYFISSPAGKAAAQQFSQDASISTRPPGAGLEKSPSEIFTLYENNIGAVTPMMAEILSEAEKAYPSGWIVKAVRIAVKNNIRRWRYVEAILQSWKQEGLDGENQSDSEEDYRRYIHGKFSQYVQH